jgi:hypothetical protein
MLGQLNFAPGVIKDDTEYDTQAYALDTNQIRWVRGRAEAMGGWTTKLAGIQGYARATHEWTSIDGTPLLALGTHTKLYVRSGDRLVDVTPERLAATLGNNPIATTNLSPLVTVTHIAHAAVVGDTVYIRGDTATGGITLGGLSGSLAASQFNSTKGLRIVRVVHVAHGLRDNDIAYFTGATSFAGINATELNTAGGLRVKVLTADTYQVEVLSKATSTSSGGGTPTYAYARPYVILTLLAGGNSYVINAGHNASATATGGGAAVKTSYDISIGPRSTRSSGGGFGSGSYGRGAFGRSSSGGIVTSAPVPLRQWSLDHWGEQLVANIVGAGIYVWDGNQSGRAILLANAPAQCMAILVTPQRFLMACGCTDYNGDFNPLLVRHSSLEDITDWTPGSLDSAGDFLLSAGSTVVGVLTRERGPMIWTDTALYAVRYVGSFDQVYDRDLVGVGCGLLGLNAAVDRDNEAFWVTPSYQLYRYAGGKPQPIECPLRTWFSKRVTPMQDGKVFGWSDPLYEAISWTFCAEGAIEANEYIRLDLPEQRRDASAGWSHGKHDRLVFSPGSSFPAKKPLGVSATGILYEHETGFDADGEPIERHVQFGPTEATPVNGEAGDHTLHIDRVVVDVTNTETLELVLRARQYPKGKVWTRTAMVTATSQHTDIRISGRQIGMELRGSTKTAWRMGSCRAGKSAGPLV